MKTPRRNDGSDAKQIRERALKTNNPTRQHFAQSIANRGRNSLAISAKLFALFLALAFVPVLRVRAQSAQDWHFPDIPWAFPVPDKVQPVREERGGPQHVPGSTKSYTQDQIDDFQNPPDWFPEEHAPMPKVVAHGGAGATLGCASCHLASGLGHPESAYLAGVSAAYIQRQLADFKARNRMGERMNDIAKDLSDEDANEASQWFSKLPPKVWESVVETDRVPKSFVNIYLMRLPLPGGGDEPLGNRIIELPRNPSRAESRDPHSGYISYVPKGSLAKGEEFVTTGGGGKTIQCAVCHGPSLSGVDEVPAIAGHSPLYLFRQLYYFKDGSRHGSVSALMKSVVAHMTQDDMLAIAAYVGSLTPADDEAEK